MDTVKRVEELGDASGKPKKEVVVTACGVLAE